MTTIEILQGIKNWVTGKLSTKQDTLTFDTTPTSNSANPVTSNGIHSAIDANTSVSQVVVVEDGEFSEGGYTVKSGTLTPTTSTTNWCHKIYPIDSYIKAVKVVVAIPSQGLPAAIYLRGEEPTEANRIVGAEQYATTPVSGAYYRFDGELIIPSAATHVLINCATAYNDESNITFKTPVINMFSKIITVDINGKGSYMSIAQAVTAAEDGDTILVYPGVYEEVVKTYGKDIHIVGVCRETCILTNGYGDYARCPLVMYRGSVENMTVIADTYNSEITDPTTEQVRTAYAVHIEGAYSSSFIMLLRNCKLLSKWNAAIGLGIHINQTIVIDNCELISECVATWSNSLADFVAMGALFFHNDATPSAPTTETGYLTVRNSKLYGVSNALSMLGIANRPYAEIEYINNNLCTEENGVTNIVDHFVDGDNGRIITAVNSYGNNISELNA